MLILLPDVELNFSETITGTTDDTLRMREHDRFPSIFIENNLLNSVFLPVKDCKEKNTLLSTWWLYIMKHMTSIMSWNVNGLRAIHKKGFFEKIIKKDFDIVCLQETKVEAEQLTEEVRNPSGYFSYFNHSRTRKGYSGVSVYTKVKPVSVEEGMGLKDMDNEGRLLVLYYSDFVLLNCYFPNGGGGPERLKYKLDFYDAFLGFTNNLRKKGHKVVICGDVNTAHEAIDLARPKENETNTGFLPEERAWIDELVNSGYVDTFRHFSPRKEGAYTYWDMKTAARERNVGWRIDYFFVSLDLLPQVKQATIMDDFYGSDHCPITLELK